MLDKEVKKNKALLAILGKQEVKLNPEVKQDTGVEQQSKKEGVPLAPETEQTTPKKKRNERSYARFRGKSEDGEETKAMSYYISKSDVGLIETLVVEGIGKDKSAVVRAAIRMYAKHMLKKIKKQQ